MGFTPDESAIIVSYASRSRASVMCDTTVRNRDYGALRHRGPVDQGTTPFGQTAPVVSLARRKDQRTTW